MPFDKQELHAHDALVRLANERLTDKPFINTVFAKDHLDGAADAALAGDEQLAYNYAVVGAHFFFNRGVR